MRPWPWPQWTAATSFEFASRAAFPQITALPQASMDPEQVRRFAGDLTRFNTDLQNRLAALTARFNAPGDTWQDQENLKFAGEFKDTMKVFKFAFRFRGKKSRRPRLLRLNFILISL